MIAARTWVVSAMYLQDKELNGRGRHGSAGYMNKLGEWNLGVACYESMNFVSG